MLPIVLASAILCLATCEAKFVSIDLKQRSGEIRHSKHDLQRRALPDAAIPETSDAGFWYGSFNVGLSYNLSLLIDTGSGDLVVNPDLYIPSAASEDLNETKRFFYITTQENGCGEADIQARKFNDTVTLAGLKAVGQRIGSIIATPPPNSAIITQFPHQGIVGLAGSTATQTPLRGVPFFQTLCNQGQVEECRFGLAFGTKGHGRQIFGGVDHRGGIDANLTEYTGVQEIMFDSGTSNIIGDLPMVRALFKNLGIQAVEQNLPGCSTTLFGYYPCDAPPTVAFQLGDSSVPFGIEHSAFKMVDNGKNNCTATITGQALGAGSWMVGQSWFQGKYVDHDVTGQQRLSEARVLATEIVRGLADGVGREARRHVVDDILNCRITEVSLCVNRRDWSTWSWEANAHSISDQIASMSLSPQLPPHWGTYPGIFAADLVLTFELETHGAKVHQLEDVVSKAKKWRFDMPLQEDGELGKGEMVWDGKIERESWERERRERFGYLKKQPWKKKAKMVETRVLRFVVRGGGKTPPL
ncbi:hypothetical protein G7046_g8156 [Stylonectria norvegica]|nr:hypothetical protein G7046_g8156 [Stylonectria norvegica]